MGCSGGSYTLHISFIAMASWKKLQQSQIVIIIELRRRNTRYKNLQLGAQNCFCSSLGLMFLVFHLARSGFCCITKLILRYEKRETSNLNLTRNNVARKLNVFVSSISPP